MWALGRRVAAFDGVLSASLDRVIEGDNVCSDRDDRRFAVVGGHQTSPCDVLVAISGV